jgi:hypothetical protein
MEKPIVLSPNRRRQCWECHRRRLVCDFSLPGCRKCYTAGVECPGYGEKKPLKWVPAGEVTSRPRKKTIQPTTTKQHVAEDRSDGQVVALSLSVPRDRLVTEPGAIVEAAYYCEFASRFESATVLRNSQYLHSTGVYLPAPASRKRVHYFLSHGKSSSHPTPDPLHACLSSAEPPISPTTPPEQP